MLPWFPCVFACNLLSKSRWEELSLSSIHIVISRSRDWLPVLRSCGNRFYYVRIFDAAVTCSCLATAIRGTDIWLAALLHSLFRTHFRIAVRCFHCHARVWYSISPILTTDLARPRDRYFVNTHGVWGDSEGVNHSWIVFLALRHPRSSDNGS